MRFTDTAIRKLKAKEARYEVFEEGRPGFGIRVTPKRKKSWFWLYRHQGRSRRVTFGSYPEVDLHTAHLKHAEAKQMLSQGLDPGDLEASRKQQERHAITVNILASEYLTRHAIPNKRSWREDERILKKDILPAWRYLKAKDITRRDVIALLDRIQDRGATVITNRTLSLIKKLFNFGVERAMLDVSPAAGIRPPAKEMQRDRVLSEDEIKALWLGLDGTCLSERIQLALKLQLLTGQRKGEILSSTWDQFDFEKAVWTIPGSVAKNGRTHTVPLSPQAMAIAQRLFSFGGRYLLPGRYGDKPMTARYIDKGIRKALPILGISRFTSHDLRRTAASHMTGIGIPRLVVSKILNHTDRDITAIYDRHDYNAEKRKALEAWGRKVDRIVLGGEGAEVVDLVGV